jgi:hypothetical protein
MTKHIATQFAGYMTARYGPAWTLRTPADQLSEIQQAFYMGALAYQGLVLKTFDPGEGPLTPEEEARGEQMFAEIADEIESYGKNHIIDLFARATNGGGRA